MKKQEELKRLFQTGKKLTEENFADLIDSFVHRTEDLAVADNKIGIGIDTPEARLHIIHQPQDSNGNTLILGPTSGSNLRLGYHSEYSWIQSHGAKPLRINEIGNHTLLNPNAGNVGIGTTEPDHRLHVSGQTNVLSITGNMNGAGAKATTARIEATDHQISEFGTIFNLKNGGGNFDLMNIHYQGDSRFYVHSNGRVGIGTTKPTHKLDIRGDINTRGHIWFYPYEGADQSGTVFIQARTDVPDTDIEMQIRTQNAGKLTEAMRIDKDGNVGIGTQSPAHRLDVNGTVNAKAILVNGQPLQQTAGRSYDGNNLTVNDNGYLGIGIANPERSLHIRGDVIRLERDTPSPAIHLIRYSENYEKIRKTFSISVDASGDNDGKLHISDRGTTTGGGGAKPRMTIDHNGKVGIGTTEPGAGLSVVAAEEDILHLSKSSNQAGDNIYLSFSHGNNTAADNIRARIGLNVKQGGDGRLIFHTGKRGNTSEKLRIDENGNVGIGIDTPEARLHIIHQPQNSDGNTLILGPTSGSNLRLGYHSEYSWIQSHGAKPLHINEIGNHTLLNLNAGNVGIGTQSPAYRLDVNGTINAKAVSTASLHLQHNAAAVGTQDDWKGHHEVYDFLKYIGGGDSKDVNGISFGMSIDAPLQDNASPDSRIQFKLNSKQRGDNDWGSVPDLTVMTLKGNGNVGIGTAEPAHRLDVDGNIHASGTLEFFAQKTRQMVNLWGARYGIGIQNSTQYFRTSKHFAWFRGGIHHDDPIAAGTGGSVDMALKDGKLGIGTGNPTHKFHVYSGAAVGLFESTEEQAYLRFYTKEGKDNRVELANRKGGRLALWVGGSGDTVNILRNGKVGIGTENPENKLEVKGALRVSTDTNFFKMHLPDDNQRVVFTLSKTTHGANKSISWDGDANWDAFSDKSLKTNIANEKGILSRLMQLNVKNYHWKDNPQQNPKPIGFIAQDVKPLFPSLTGEYKDEETQKPVMTLKYASFGVLAVGGLKELKQEKDREIAALKKELEALKKIVAAMK